MTSAAEALASSIVEDLEAVAHELSRESGLPELVAFGMVFEEFMRVDRDESDGLLSTFIADKLRAANNKRAVHASLVH